VEGGKKSVAASKYHDSELESVGISHTLLQDSTPACLAQQNKLHKTSTRYEPELPKTLQVTYTHAYQKMN